jgi:hypothetical protein
MKLKQLLNEIDFSSQSAFDAYKEKHKMRDTTKVKVAGKETTVGDASKKSSSTTKAKGGASAGSKKVEPKSKTISSNIGVDSVVYNKRTKTVGIVRLGDERGETKTDADGNVNTSELEPYNPLKYPHQKNAKVAPSTSKEIDSRGLWKPFSNDEEPKKEEPKSEPAKKRPGNPTINKHAKKKAEDFGITPQKLGREYPKTMLKAAIEALTDSNFHQEARELVAAIEGKPEWAKKPDYPKVDDPKFKEKMADIKKNSSDSSEYWDYDENTREYASSITQESGWDGVDSADAIAFTLRMNGFHKQADMIQSVFDNKGYMKKESLTLKSAIGEAKSDYAVYHKTYTSAINTAREYAEKKGYQIDDDDAFRQIGMGPKKPSDGKTNRFSIQLTKDGKPQKKHLHIQVYGMGTYKRNPDGSKTRSIWGGQNEYELNTYIG